MIRRSFPILSRLSLLICVLLIAAWVGGQRRANWLGWARTDSAMNRLRTWYVVNGTSGVYLHWQRLDFLQQGQALVCARRERNGISFEITEPAENPFVGGMMAYGRPSPLGSFFIRLGLGYNEGEVFSQPYYGGFKREDHYVHVPYWMLMA